jgi:hypothetical protein
MRRSKWFRTLIAQTWEFQVFQRIQIAKARVAGERKVPRLSTGSLPLLAGSRGTWPLSNLI